MSTPKFGFDMRSKSEQRILQTQNLINKIKFQSLYGKNLPLSRNGSNENRHQNNTLDKLI